MRQSIAASVLALAVLACGGSAPSASGTARPAGPVAIAIPRGAMSLGESSLGGLEVLLILPRIA